MTARAEAAASIVHVELRPPRAGLDTSSGMDAWIDLNHAVRRFTAGRRRVFLTDDAVVLAKPGMADHVKAPTGDEAKTYLDFLVENKVPFYV